MTSHRIRHAGANGSRGYLLTRGDVSACLLGRGGKEGWVVLASAGSLAAPFSFPSSGADFRGSAPIFR